MLVKRHGRLKLVVPTIHTNGTTREALIAGYVKAADAVLAAQEAVDAASPNARDYYPQGPGAIIFATTQHYKRLTRLRRIREEMLALAEELDQ